MGSLQQQSTLKGKKVNSENEAIIPKIFQKIQAQFSKQTAIIYEGKNFLTYRSINLRNFKSINKSYTFIFIYIQIKPKNSK